MVFSYLIINGIVILCLIWELLFIFCIGESVEMLIFEGEVFVSVGKIY